MSAQRFDATVGGPVMFVNRFTVQAPAEEFERVFAETSEYFRRQPGFVRNTLLRHTDHGDRYVNIAHWRDEESFQSAVTQPDFKPHAEALRALSTSEPNLYTPRQMFAAEAADDRLC